MISIVICTYNRNPLLEKCIESVINQNFSDDYEILIIDNHPSEIAYSVFEKFSFNNKLRYFSEKKVGLSYARNRGIIESKGDIIVFIDDDAIADKEWLKNLIEVHRTTNAAIVGGKIEPIAEIPFPHWFYKELCTYIAVLDYSQVVKKMEGKNINPYGCNFSAKKEIFSKVGLFRTSLGRKGNSLISNEDTDFFEKVKEFNFSIYYTPFAIVKHFIHKERMTRIFFIKRLYAQGISDRIQDLENNNSPNFIKKLRIIGNIYRYLIKFIFYLLIADQKRYLRNLLRSCYFLGYLVGSRYRS